MSQDVSAYICSGGDKGRKWCTVQMLRGPRVYGMARLSILRASARAGFSGHFHPSSVDGSRLAPLMSSG
eukprot:4429233-Pleurochrysis_carterae.AAC.5